MRISGWSSDVCSSDPDTAPDGTTERTHGLAHGRELAHDIERAADSSATGQFEFHQLAVIELHEGIAGGIDRHPGKINLVVGERGRDLEIAKPGADEESHQQGACEPRCEHETEVSEELAAAGEVDRKSTRLNSSN